MHRSEARHRRTIINRTGLQQNHHDVHLFCRPTLCQRRQRGQGPRRILQAQALCGQLCVLASRAEQSPAGTGNGGELVGIGVGTAWVTRGDGVVQADDVAFVEGEVVGGAPHTDVYGLLQALLHGGCGHDALYTVVGAKHNICIIHQDNNKQAA